MKVIRDPKTGEPYLLRWSWRPCRWFGFKIHRILREDFGRDLHDHPWWFASLVLRGWYDEEVPARFPRGLLHRAEVGTTVRRIRWFNFKRATGSHRIVRVARHTWTFVITGREDSRQWGFHTASGWVPWQKYLMEGQ